MAKSEKRNPVELIDLCNLDHTASVIEIVSKHIKQLYPNTSDGAPNITGYFINRIRVQFSKDVSFVEFENSYLSSVGIVHAPIIPDESPEEQQERAKELVKFFAPVTKEVQLNSSIKLFAMMPPKDQKELLERHLQQQNTDRK